MPETVFGLPLHILFNHAPVVLIPLSTLGALVLALVPRARPAVRWPLLFVLTSALVSVPLTTQSGNALLVRLVREGALGGSALAKVQRHQDFGGLVLWPVLALWLLVVALTVLDLRGRPTGRGVARAVAALTVVAAVTATALVMVTGHLGSEAVWDPAG